MKRIEAPDSIILEGLFQAKKILPSGTTEPSVGEKMDTRRGLETPDLGGRSKLCQVCRTLKPVKEFRWAPLPWPRRGRVLTAICPDCRMLTKKQRRRKAQTSHAEASPRQP